MPTEQTAEIARAYFKSWTAGDRDGVAKALAEDFVFESPMITMQGRQAMLDSQAWPKGATTTIVAEAYQDDRGFQLYDAVNGPNSVRIAECLQVRDGHLARSTIVVDTAAFQSFFGM